MRLKDLAEALDAQLIGDGEIEIARPVHPAEAENPEDLALAMEPALVKLLPSCKAGAAIVTAAPEVGESGPRSFLVVGRERYAMANVMRVFKRPISFAPGIDASAVIAETAEIAEDVAIGAFTCVGPGARIGSGSVLLDQVTVGAGAEIGEDCLFHPGVRIGERVVIGKRVILQSNACIGADGFSYVTPEPGSIETAKAQGPVKATKTDIVRINSFGTVILEDDVEIGACTTVDRATVAATRIGRNTKIDNLVMIGHNSEIGENCLICGQVGIAGSTKIGDRVVLAGRAAVGDHLTVGHDSIVAAASVVGQNVPPGAIMVGVPAMPRQKFFEQLLHLRRLPSMAAVMKALEERVKALESAEKGV